MFSHPFFWRHFGAITIGGALLTVGVLVPALAPALVPAGATLLLGAGTKLIEPKPSKGDT